MSKKDAKELCVADQDDLLLGVMTFLKENKCDKVLVEHFLNENDVLYYHRFKLSSIETNE